MSDDDCGCGEKRTRVEGSAPQVLSLEAHEAALHASGIKRGHGEGIAQVAKQLRDYVGLLAQPLKDCRTKKDLAKLLDDVLAGTTSIAGQLDDEAGKASAEAQQKLTEAIGLKARAEQLARRTVLGRARDAARGALCGWRGR